MQYNLDLVARGPPPPFSGPKEIYFLHNIGVDEREVKDKKKKKDIRK